MGKGSSGCRNTLSERRWNVAYLEDRHVVDQQLISQLWVKGQ